MPLHHLRILSQQAILKHYKKPRYLGRTRLVDDSHLGHNPSYGDTIDLTVQLSDDQSQFEGLKLEGQGRAIAMAAADLMAGALLGKTLAEAKDMVQWFQHKMKGGAESPKVLRTLNVMQGVAQFPASNKCATLTCHTLEAALEQGAAVDKDAFISKKDQD